jgi:antitoxin HicB
MKYSYPVDLEDDEGTVLATFPDFPGATFGEDRDEALLRAVDLLESSFIWIIQDRELIPKPSPAKGRPLVQPTLTGSLKIAIYEAMRGRGWRKADLARAMALNPRQIDRLLDLRHASTLAQLEAALAACGKRAVVETQDLAA